MHLDHTIILRTGLLLGLVLKLEAGEAPQTPLKSGYTLQEWSCARQPITATELARITSEPPQTPEKELKKNLRGEVITDDMRRNWRCSVQHTKPILSRMQAKNSLLDEIITYENGWEAFDRDRKQFDSDRCHPQYTAYQWKTALIAGMVAHTTKGKRSVDPRVYINPTIIDTIICYMVDNLESRAAINDYLQPAHSPIEPIRLEFHSFTDMKPYETALLLQGDWTNNEFRVKTNDIITAANTLALDAEREIPKLRKLKFSHIMLTLYTWPDVSEYPYHYLKEHDKKSYTTVSTTSPAISLKKYIPRDPILTIKQAVAPLPVIDAFIDSNIRNKKNTDHVLQAAIVITVATEGQITKYPHNVHRVVREKSR